MPEDKYIWEEFKKGEEYALSFIYNQNIDFLYSYGKRITRDEALLLDVIQDLFYELIRSRKNLGRTDNIRLYLIKSFRRKLIREIKQRQKRQHTDQEIEVVPEIIFSVEEDFIFNEEKSQRFEIIQKGLKELNQQQREFLYYRFSLGFDYKQISEIMQVTNDSARQQVSRAIKLLKKYFENNSLLFFLVFRNLLKKPENV